MKNRMHNLFGLLMLMLLAVVFQPQLQVTDHGVQLTATSRAYAEGENQSAENSEQTQEKTQQQENKSKQENNQQQNEQRGKKEETEESEKEKNEQKSNSEDKENKSSGKSDDTDYVSREEYESLKNDLSSLTKARQEEVVQRRVDHAINESYIDKDDADAVAEVREIAKNDGAWKSYKKIASPKTPDHISARRFQKNSLKSTKHTGDSKMLDTVLEHQQA